MLVCWLCTGSFEKINGEGSSRGGSGPRFLLAGEVSKMAQISSMNPNMLKLAKRLVLSEAKDSNSHQSKIEAGFTVCEKLRQELVTLSGISGVCALLNRTVQLLHKEDIVGLGIVKIRSDGSVERAEIIRGPGDQEALERDPVILPAQLLDLLVTLIGETLAVQIVGTVWPEVELADMKQDVGQKEGAK